MRYNRIRSLYSSSIATRNLSNIFVVSFLVLVIKVDTDESYQVLKRAKYDKESYSIPGNRTEYQVKVQVQVMSFRL